MGMDAEIYVDDEYVDAYKCKHAWNKIILERDVI